MENIPIPINIKNGIRTKSTLNTLRANRNKIIHIDANNDLIIFIIHKVIKIDFKI
jgi:hypothetical protein